MTKRARIGILVILILLVVLFIVVRVKKNDDNLPVSGPIPASSVPTTSTDLAELQLRLAPVASVASPTAFAVRKDDSSLYVTEQEGRVRRIRRSGNDFALDDQPVLDITSEVTAAGEQGLLGLAFADDGRTLYFAFTNRNQDQQLDEISFDGDRADTWTRRTLLTIPDFAPNHNGGDVLVGPDGFVYWTMGDGGGAGDPRRSGQDPKDLLGNILRIDPAHPGTDGRPYAIPADNPFANGANGAPEVWQYGLRNPWRVTFDRQTRDLWIADVGQSAIEEINFVPAPAPGGLNFGWSDVEGTHPFREPQPPAGAIAPIYEYDHSGGRCSITGGYVYRGNNIPALQGTYLFADYCDGKIYGLVRKSDGSVSVTDLRLTALELMSFGEDADGEQYVLSAQNGVQRIEVSAPQQAPAAPPTSASAAGPSLPPTLSGDPSTAADQLVAAERALRDPASSSQTLDAAAHLQQLAYRRLGRQPELDAMVLAKAGPDLDGAVAANLDARHELAAIPGGPLRDTLPAWRIIAPASSDDLLAYYHEAEAQFGVGWNYLAAINLVESALGRIQGLSTAGAQGPMQFIQSTWDAFGDGDINSPHDSILGAARYLAHNGFAEGNVDGALFNYNRSSHYVNAIKDIASVLAADPSAFGGYYRWEVFYATNLGDVHLPVGYETPEPIPAADYIAAHPQE